MQIAKACNLFPGLVKKKKKEKRTEEGFLYVALEQLRNRRRDSPHVIVS